MTQILFATITQSGNDENGELTITILEKFCPALEISEKIRTETGKVKCTLNMPVLNTNMPTRWYLSDSHGHRYAVSSLGNETQFEITAYNGDDEPQDGLLSSNEFKIFTFN